MTPMQSEVALAKATAMLEKAREELERLRAGVEAMRPVVDAACEWNRLRERYRQVSFTHGASPVASAFERFDDAVDAYRAARKETADGTE